MLDRRQIHTVIDTLIREARIRSVSDIHITEGMPVWYSRRILAKIQYSVYRRSSEHAAGTGRNI